MGKVGCLSHIVEVEGVAQKELEEMHPLQSLVVRLRGVSDLGRQEGPYLVAELTEVREPVGGYVRLAEQDEMGSSEEEESGMESGVDTYSRSSSRRGEEREDVDRAEHRVEEGGIPEGNEGETLEALNEGNEAEKSRKRKRSESTLDPKRLKVQGVSKQCSNENNATEESEVENNNDLSKKVHLLPLQPQALNSPKPKTPAKDPIPSCIKRKVKKFNGINTSYFYHACDDHNYEDMRQVRAWMAEHPGHTSAPSVTTASRGLESLPNCMKRVKVEKKFIIRHLCDSASFSNVAKARTWLTENPEHKPCPTLWFKGNTGEDEEADEGGDQEDSGDEDKVAGTDKGVESLKVEKTVEDVVKDKTEKFKPKERTGDEKNSKPKIDQEQEGFEADSEEADTDAEGNQKKKKLKPVGGKVRSRRSTSGDETESSRSRSFVLTQKNAPPCMRRSDKKVNGKRCFGFKHQCDDHWFSSWQDTKAWLEKNPGHISSSTSMAISPKEGKKSQGEKATDAKKVPAASAKKLEENEKKKKQSGSGDRPLAVVQSTMEKEVGGSQVKAEGTKSPDMFDSEEENGGMAEEVGKEEATGKEKAKQTKKKGTTASCKEGPEESEESESDDSGDEIGNSKSRMIGRQLEKELENSSVGGRNDSKETTGGNANKETTGGNNSKEKTGGNANKDANKEATGGNDGKEKAADKNTNLKGSQVVAEVNDVKGGNAATVRSGVIGKAGEKTASSNKEEEEESSSSDSGSETEGFIGAEEANDTTAAKKAVKPDVKKRMTEQSSSSGSESESESEEESCKVTKDPKSSSQGTKASIDNKKATAVSPSKVGATEKKKDEESSSSSSESDSDTGTTPPITRMDPKSAPVAALNASKKPPLGFSAPRLESFKKSGFSSPSSTAITSGLKGPSVNISVYDSPNSKAKDSSSESSGSSNEESSGEEIKKKKVAGIKKVRKTAPSSSSESGSGSSDNEDALDLVKGKKPEGPKTSSTVSKMTEALGKKKSEGKSGEVAEKNKNDMEKKEKIEKESESAEKAASPTKNLKTKENKLPVTAQMEQGKTVTINKIRANAPTVSKAGLKEKVSSPLLKSRNLSPAKSADVKTSSIKSSEVKTSPDDKSRDESPAKASVNLGNKKKADAKQIKEKEEPPEKLAKVVEKKKDIPSPSKTTGSDSQKQVEKKDTDQQSDGMSQPDENLAKEPKKKKDSPSPSKTKDGEPEKEEVEKKIVSSSEKKSPQLSSTLVPRNNPVEKLKIQDMECSPILKKVKDAFGSYFEKTMIDGEEESTVKNEVEKQEEDSVKKKKKKKNKKEEKEKKPVPGFL